MFVLFGHVKAFLFLLFMHVIFFVLILFKGFVLHRSQKLLTHMVRPYFSRKRL